MPTPAETDLESLLMQAAKDVTHAPDFLAHLIEATVLVPGALSTPVAGAVNRLDVTPLVNENGGTILPFYTSQDRVQETLDAMRDFEPPILAMRCREFWEATRGAELVLNPHSAHGKRFLPEEVAQMLDGRAPLSEHVVKEPTPVFVGEPAKVPVGMKEELSALFADKPLVHGAYLGWEVTPSSGEQNYLLVLVGPAGLRESVSDDLGRALVFYSQAYPVDVVYELPGEHRILSGIAAFYGETD